MEQPVENTAQPINTAGAGEYWGLVQSAHKVLVDAENAAAYVGLLPYADILRATQPESTKPADRQVASYRRCRSRCGIPRRPWGGRLHPGAAADGFVAWARRQDFRTSRGGRWRRQPVDRRLASHGTSNFTTRSTAVLLAISPLNSAACNGCSGSCKQPLPLQSLTCSTFIQPPQNWQCSTTGWESVSFRTSLSGTDPWERAGLYATQRF